MKVMKFLKRNEIVELYRQWYQGLSVDAARHSVNISYPAAKGWIDEIQLCLGGEPIKRTKGHEELRMALRDIKAWMNIRPAVVPEVQIPPTPPAEQVPLPTDTTETKEQKIERLWADLKIALGEYALELAMTKNKELVEAAKESNIVGFINNRWSR